MKGIRLAVSMVDYWGKRQDDKRDFYSAYNLIVWMAILMARSMGLRLDRVMVFTTQVSQSAVFTAQCEAFLLAINAQTPSTTVTCK
jgi:hypothetical protein